MTSSSLHAQSLINQLKSVDWADNVAKSVAVPDLVEAVSGGSLRLAVWARQLESIEKGNPALCFIREMQVAGYLVATSSALGVYKAAAASMRSVVETALYYSYFRNHSAELATLLRDDKWYISKDEILEHHATHTAGFVESQKILPIQQLLKPWYSKMSAVIHGQVPGAWLKHTTIKSTSFDPLLAQLVAENFSQAVEIVNRLFLATLAPELWDYFSGPAKKAITHGLHGDVKKALSLDAA